MSTPATNNPHDFWAEDDFEDTVAAALISCFETKAKKNRGAVPSDRINDARIAVLRKEGPYIASNSRLVECNFSGNWGFDLVNDRLPAQGLVAFRPIGKSAESRPNAYLFANYVRQVSQPGKGWHRQAGGQLYEMLVLSAEPDGIDGDRRFFSVSSDGTVHPCELRLSTSNRGTDFGVKNLVVKNDEEIQYETGAWASVTLQTLADRRHCWTITASESSAKAHLGCMHEEIKSLLYARSLPLTATGRKRPVLHLVEAHRRRMKSGVDVDIDAFLRGQRTVEIDGTMFTVNPPPRLRDEVSANSVKHYFEVKQQPITTMPNRIREVLNLVEEAGREHTLEIVNRVEKSGRIHLELRAGNGVVRKFNLSTSSRNDFRADLNEKAEMRRFARENAKPSANVTTAVPEVVISVPNKPRTITVTKTPTKTAPTQKPATTLAAAVTNQTITAPALAAPTPDTTSAARELTPKEFYKLCEWLKLGFLFEFADIEVAAAAATQAIGQAVSVGALREAIEATGKAEPDEWTKQDAPEVIVARELAAMMQALGHTPSKPFARYLQTISA